MTYVIKLTDGTEDRQTCNDINITVQGALMLSNGQGNLVKLYNKDTWLSVEPALIQQTN